MTHNAHLIRGFVSSCGWVIAPPPWRRGPQVRAPWHHGGHGAVDVVGPMAPPGRASGRGTQECTQIGENSLSAQPPLACGVRPLVTSRWRRWCKMRFSVRVRTQNALFRRVRFSSPAQTWSHLTERRILRRRSHVKAQSAPATSRKGALCTPDLTEKRTLWPAHTQNALFRESDTPRMRLSVSCRLQSGVLVYTVATRFAEASTHTNPRRALKGQHWSIRER